MLKVFAQSVMFAATVSAALFAIECSHGYTYELVHYDRGNVYVDDYNLTYSDCILETASDPMLHCERSN